MEEPSDDENDMLDLAFGLTETSRLGCQVKMKKELDGLVVSFCFIYGPLTPAFVNVYSRGAGIGEVGDVALWLT